MKIKYLPLFLLLFQHVLFLSAQQTKVMTLGTFHFSFRNLDVQETESSNQIDVLKPKHQMEIEHIVDLLAEYEPTIIAIEVDPSGQSRIDSVYNAYLDGKHQLKRDEVQQIGFRLAKRFNLKTLHCVNDWGELPVKIRDIVYGNDSIANQRFVDFFYNNPDSSRIYEAKDIYKTQGILNDLQKRNSEEEIKKDFGNYFISIFKYETEENKSFGVDFTTGWWFNRNLQIFRNIQKIPSDSDDRILVIYGSGHLNVFNRWFDVSPEYDLVNTNDYLK
jgi:hypothetical protein